MTPTDGILQLIEDLGAIFTGITGFFSDVLGMFVSEPLLILMLGIMVTGAIIGLTMRLLHRG